MDICIVSTVNSDLLAWVESATQVNLEDVHLGSEMEFEEVVSLLSHLCNMLVQVVKREAWMVVKGVSAGTHPHRPQR